MGLTCFRLWAINARIAKARAWHIATLTHARTIMAGLVTMWMSED